MFLWETRLEGSDKFLNISEEGTNLEYALVMVRLLKLEILKMFCPSRKRLKKNKNRQTDKRSLESMKMTMKWPLHILSSMS